MKDFIDITLIANAGVLIEHDGTGLLIDGIHHENGHSFSTVTEDDLARMQRREQPFDALDYLLFTHEHADHFSPERVLEHVRTAQPRGIFLPGDKDASPALTVLLSHLHQRDIPHHRLGLEPGQTKNFILTDNLTVTAIGTRHMGPQYQHVRNDCFLLTMGDLRVLLTGDGDHVPAYYTNVVQTGPLDAIFVNPIYFHHPDGKTIIDDIFRPRHVIIYHMPPAENDTYNFAYMVGRDMEKYARPDRQIHVLHKEKQQIRLLSAR